MEERILKWKEVEEEIQYRSKFKDDKFKLQGEWKVLIAIEDGFHIYKVDAEWIRNNICCTFGHGGHGLVHEFIPLNEIWVSSHHAYREDFPTILSECDCEVTKKGMPVTLNFFKSTMLHEIREHNLMLTGMEYEKAHKFALQYEKELGILTDPYKDI